MWKLMLGNPLYIAIFLAVVIGVGFSSGMYFKGLQADKTISALKLEHKNLQLSLSESLVKAQQAARASENKAQIDQAARQKEWQDTQVKLEKQHDRDKQALNKFKAQGGGNTLSRDAVIAWLRDNPDVANDDKHVPPPARDSSPIVDRGTACTESDLLADRNNWKEAYSTCSNRLSLCKSTLTDWHKQINGDK